MQFGINSLRISPPNNQTLEYAVKMAGKKKDDDAKKESSNDSFDSENQIDEIVKVNETIAELTKTIDEKEKEIDQLIECYQQLLKDINKSLVN